jgi:hypothetical protein
VSADTQIDLSGYWNDTDVRIVCDSLIKTCLDSPRVTQVAANLGRLPVVLVGTFKNDSDEYIDTTIISRTMAKAILNSGKANFIPGVDAGNKTGVDFLLTGTVRTIIDRAGNTTIRTYFVSAEMTNVETNARLWMGQNSEIKKVVKNAALF